MTRSHLIVFLIAVSLIFTSCVSKKKFLEMQTGRLKAEELSRQLDEENSAKAIRIEALIVDFEEMKNELIENNYIKDQYIDSLTKEVFTLTENMNQQSESLEETSFTLDFEKQRLTNVLAGKDKTINSLETKIGRLENEVQQKSSVVDQKNFDLKLLQDKIKLVEASKKAGENTLAGLQADLAKVKTETDNLKAQLKEKDATITKLQNNVNLLKKEIGNN